MSLNELPPLDTSTTPDLYMLGFAYSIGKRGNTWATCELYRLEKKKWKSPHHKQITFRLQEKTFMHESTWIIKGNDLNISRIKWMCPAASVPLVWLFWVHFDRRHVVFRLSVLEINQLKNDHEWRLYEGTIEKWSWMAFNEGTIVTYLHFQSYHVSNVFHVLDAERYFQLLYHSVRLHSSPFTLSSFRDPREKRSGRSYGTGNKDHRRKNPAGNYRSNKYKRERNERVTPQEKRPRLAQAHRVFLVLELCGVWYWFFLGP